MYKIVDAKGRIVAVCTQYKDALAMVNTNYNDKTHILTESE
jgi:hypothetical protein